MTDADRLASIRRDIKGAYTIWYRDLLRFLRDRNRIFGSLGMPLLYLFVFGNGLAPAISGLGGGTINFKQFMYPGILAMVVMFTSVFSAISIVWDREFGFLKEVLVAPVSRAAVALGKVAGGSTVAVFQGALILVLAPFIGLPFSIPQAIVLVGLMLFLAVAMTSLGILVAARQRTMEGFQVIMQFLIMPLFFLSGALFPLRRIPLWLEWLARIDPMTYGVDPLRQVALRGNVSTRILQTLSLHPITTDLAVLGILTLLFLVPAVWLFSQQD